MKFKFVIASILMFAVAPLAHAFTTFIPQCQSFINGLESPQKAVIAGEPFTIQAHAGSFGNLADSSYEWFKGPLGDTSGGVIATGPTLTTSQTDTSTYWLRLQASCGDAVTSAVTVQLDKGACAGHADQLCVSDLRYRVTVEAKGPNNQIASGVALYQTNAFGYFSLPAFTGDPTLPEVMVKVLGPVNGKPWVFYAGLTNLDYIVDVTDTLTGVSKSYEYFAPTAFDEISYGNFDVDGFSSNVCSKVTVHVSSVTPAPECKNGTGQICLLDRFLVTMNAQDDPLRSNKSGDGVAVPGNRAFGFFSVPAVTGDPTSIESFIKMVDATQASGHYWLFLGGLTDIEFKMTVTDTKTGLQNIYTKPVGSTCGINDTSAFQF